MFRSVAIGAVAFALFGLAGCSSNTGNAVSEESWDVGNFLYQLQRANAVRIGETEFDLVVTTIDVAGSSPETVPALKTSPGGEKTVLAYMSIGQAEDYRFYWDAAWKQNPPSWLDEGDENWRGDYWVRYWEPGWQHIIFGTPESYLDKIIGLGFDGVYLDRVDTYQFYEERDGRTTAAQEMVEFILAFTDYARQMRPGFGVFPQNAEELGLIFPEYLEEMTGVGIEDLYYGGIRDHEPTPAAWTDEREAVLATWVEAGKLVLTIDYSSKPDQISDAYARSIGNGFVPYVTDRSLGRIRINPGFEPSRSLDEYVYTEGDSE
ncbi:MAG: endo alpha-1,4 polygalactosaminidase [Acidimicrobiia bacterium]|nr:MAG: endo alpha-1,4 polygalactosaminidase [Acidimicrobiia bacterium]